MIKNFISAIILGVASVIILSSNIYPQIVEKNRVFYRNFKLNPDTINHLNQELLLNKNTFGNPIEPPIIKNDFMVNTLDGDYGCEQRSVSTAMDGQGNYAFTWIDTRNDKVEIFAQFFDSNGNRIGSNFKVNEGDLIGNNSPFIAANKNGDFVITWLQSFRSVVAQKFTNTGQKVGGNIIVNTISGWNTMEPCVAIDNDGSFMVMWSSEPGNWVYARLIDKTGIPIGNQITVSESDKSISSIGQGKHIAVDEAGNYCLTWSSYGASTRSNIYLQMINRSGQMVGNNTIVSGSPSFLDNSFPDVSSTDDGNFIIVWDIYDGVGVRIYNKNHTFITNVLYLHDPGNSYSPFAISSDKDSIFYILVGGYGNQYIQKIKSNGQFIGDTVKVIINDSNLSYSYSNEISDIIKNKFVIGTDGYSKTDADVYAQSFDSGINQIGPFIKINDDVASSPQRKSLVKFNNKGQSIVLWEDRKNGRNDLFAQVYDQDFNPLNGNVQINDLDTDYWHLSSKEVQTLSDGTFIIAFTGYNEYGSDGVYLQAVNTAGEKIGKNIIVKDKIYYTDFNLAMNVSSNDEILICWYYTYGAYMKSFDKNLLSISNEKNFLSYAENLAFRPFTISVDTGFNILAVWKYYDLKSNTSGNKIVGKIINKYGQSITTTFIIDSTDSYISDIKCKNEGSKDFVIMYNDGYQFHILRRYTLDKDYYYQDNVFSYHYNPSSFNIVRFDNHKLFVTYNSSLDVKGFYANDNRRMSQDFYLHRYDYINTYYDDYNGTNSADIFNDKLIFTFEDSRNSGTCSDIWANARGLENISFKNEIFFAPVNSDFLYNNYPNPFNPKTKITYQILAYHNVKLSIYDILGREVKVLVNENQEKGIYEIEFDASDLASGIYFCRLEAFDTTIKKMILLK